MLGNLLNDLAEAIRRWTEKNAQISPRTDDVCQLMKTNSKSINGSKSTFPVHQLCKSPHNKYFHGRAQASTKSKMIEKALLSGL